MPSTRPLNLTAQQAARVGAAWEQMFGVAPADWNELEALIYQHFVRELKAIVYHGEKKAADLTFSPAPFDPT